MITIYGIFSPYVFRVRAALEFKGLPYEHVSVNLRNRSDAFRTLTPVGKIPVIEDTDGTVVYDSANIVTYLDMAYPDTYRMCATTPKESAKLWNVVTLADRILHAQTPVSYEKYGIKTSTDEEKDTARKEVASLIDRATEMLGGREYFVGDTFSHADASMVSALGTWQYVGEGMGSLAAWFAARMEDPRVTRMFPPMDTKGVREI